MRRLAPAILLAVLAAAVPNASGAERPLTTGLIDGTGAYGGADAEWAFARTVEAGARVVRMSVSWAELAPRRPVNPRDPADPAYRWKSIDDRVLLASRHGIEPLIYIAREVPAWARAHSQDGAMRPGHAEYADVAAAIATRYSGTYGGFPRVRYWQAWNEPNLDFYLVQNGAHGAVHYRLMVNGFAASVKHVHRTNLVVAGGTAPFSSTSTVTWGTPAMDFMAELLCMTNTRRPRRKCDDRVRFDVWAHNPYTSGSPTHRAANDGDVSLGDLPRMARMLRAAGDAGRIVGTRRPRFWVTEFAWDTAPPDPGGVPEREHARWVAEGLYRMWRHGVSLAVWFGLRDAVKGPNREWGESFQSGLLARGADTLVGSDRPKLAFQAFRFPFVALPARGGVLAWGRAPKGRTVVLEQRRGGRWRSVGRLRIGANGVFERRLRLRSRAALRARAAGDRSLPFVPRRTRDRRVNPFGGTQPEPVSPKEP